jgi:hypothetical protein
VHWSKSVAPVDMSAWWKYSRASRTKWYDCTYIRFFTNPSRQLLQASMCSTHHQNEDKPTREPKFSLGETPFSIKEGMSTQTNFQYLVYLFWINICFDHVLEILSIPSLWKWLMVAMLKLCKNLVHIFVLYAFFILLVYFETRAWNKTLWEANVYDQI